MRTSFITTVLMLVITASQAQDSQPQVSRQDYLNKSKRQNTMGWIFAGGGAALTTTGLLLGVSSLDNEIVASFNGEESSKFDGAAVVFYTGLAAMAASIPFFLAASKNKSRASTLSLKNETIALPQYSFRPKTFPALALTVNLGH
jgi:hypothetical protein